MNLYIRRAGNGTLPAVHAGFRIAFDAHRAEQTCKAEQCAVWAEVAAQKFRITTDSNANTMITVRDNKEICAKNNIILISATRL